VRPLFVPVPTAWALSAVLATLSSSACVSSQRPSGGANEPTDVLGADASPEDAGPGDVGGPDAVAPDVGAPDAVLPDEGLPDVEPPDGAPEDLGPPPDAGTPCTTPDDCPQPPPETCMVAACTNGTCTTGVANNGTVCGDAPDACHAAVCADGACVAQAQEGAPCDDGDPCTTDDACDGSGVCAGTPALAGAPCDDGDPDTVSDLCLGGVCAGFLRFVQSDGCDPGDPILSTTPPTHAVASAVRGTDTEWALVCTQGLAETPDSLKSFFWTSPLDGPSIAEPTLPPDAAVDTALGDWVVGVRAAFAVTHRREVFTYAPHPELRAGGAQLDGALVWGWSTAWTMPLKAVTTSEFVARAMWAHRRGDGSAALYVAGSLTAGDVVLAGCARSSESSPVTCWTKTLTAQGTEASPVALTGVPEGEGERVFAVLDSAQVSSGDNSVERYFVDLWTGGPKHESWVNAPLDVDALQGDPLARAQGLLALGPGRLLVLEDRGGLVDVTVPALGDDAWQAKFEGELATWGAPGATPVTVTYVAGLATPSAVLLVGHVTPSDDSAVRHVILRRVPRLPGGGLDWNTVFTGALGPVGLPLDCEGTAACPSVGIHDGALAPGGGSMMLVGGTRASDSQSVRATRWVRTPPSPSTTQ